MNLSPHASASFRIPEKFDDETVAEDFTPIPTTSPRLFSITMSTSFLSLSRKWEKEHLFSLHVAIFCSSLRANISRTARKDVLSFQTTSGEMPLSAARSPESRKWSLGRLCQPFELVREPWLECVNDEQALKDTEILLGSDVVETHRSADARIVDELAGMFGKGI